MTGPCPAGGDHTWTDDAGEITARNGVSIFCDECHLPMPESYEPEYGMADAITEESTHNQTGQE